MPLSRHAVVFMLLALAGASVHGCGCEDSPVAIDGADGGGGTGDAGGGTGRDTGGPGDGGGRDAGADGGDTDAGRIPDPKDPDNALIDSDCDGLSDEEEFATVYATGLKTDPANPDTDGDGIPDGVERARASSPDPNCKGFPGDADTATATDPTSPDTDCDGVPDGIEDANRNGKIDPGETDPTDPDTDGDGIPDGTEAGTVQAVAGTICPGFVPDADPATTTDPAKADTDGDGIPDGVEDRNHNGRVDVKDPQNPDYAGGDETDPAKADTDGDGISDGTEDRNKNLIVDPGETDPLVANADTDHDGLTDAAEVACGYDPNDPDMDKDGLLDGLEDKNGDCVLNLGETDPRRVDTDCDGLIDGVEDANHNGAVDPGETDPADPDSDGDGLTDGVEAGVTLNPDPVTCPGTPLDADPATTTDPTNPDSDGSGVNDGAEDTNKNGRVDPGELDPNNPDDDKGVVGEACATQNLTPVQFLGAGDADVLLALAEGYRDGGGTVNVSALTQNGETRGILFVDPAREIGGFVLDKVPDGATAVDESGRCGRTRAWGPRGASSRSRASTTRSRSRLRPGTATRRCSPRTTGAPAAATT